MKLKALLLALFVAGFSASFALADNGNGKSGDKHKSETTSKSGKSGVAACKPSVEVELRGTVATAPTATALAVLVTKGGPEGASLTGKQLTFDISAARKPATLAQGAAVQVKGRACVDLVAGTAKLVADRVELKDGETKTTSSTSTSTSTTTSTTASTTSTTTPTTTTTAAH
jgi:hypothetical protein